MKADLCNRFSAATGGTLLAFLFFMLLTEGFSFLLHLPVNGVILPLSLVLASLFCYLYIARGKVLIYALVTVIALIVSSCILFSFLYDSAYDSYGYHFEAVVMMEKGWNPVFEIPWNESVWNQHYAKGLEMLQAAVFAFTGNLQSTRCVNVLLVAAMASLSWFTLAEVFPSVSRLRKAAIVIMIIANPVVICQLTTAYNDYMLWPETVQLCCSFLLIWNNERELFPYLILLMAFVIGINSKFTHFFYVGLECLFFALWCVFSKKKHILLRGVVTVLLAVFIGIVIVGFSPYILNSVGYGNPFYPLLGGHADIMTENTPAIYEGSGRIVNFVKSMLSIGDAPWAFFCGEFAAYDVLQCYSVGSRVNGFGIMMAPLLILGLILMIFNRASWKWWAVYVYCLVVSLAFDQAWWARYIPFLWALVIIPVMNYAVKHGSPERKSPGAGGILAGLIFVLVILNATLAGAVSLVARYSYTAYINYVIDAQKESGVPIKVCNLNYSFRQMLDEKGVEYEEFTLEELPDESDCLFALFDFGDQWSIIAELPPEDYPALYENRGGIMGKITNFPNRRFTLSPSTSEIP